MVIYLTTNLITGKRYIGKDKNNNPKYLGSGTNLKKAILKYGKNSFKKIILEYCLDPKHMAEREEFWLQRYNVKDNSNFYNKTNKAFGNSGHTKESKHNIAKGLLKRKWKKEWGIKSGEKRIGKKRNQYVNGLDHGNYNKPKSKTHKENMSLARIGKKHNEEWKQAIKNNRQKCIEVKSKPIQQLDKNNNVLNEYKSITEARNKTNIKGIANVLCGLAKTAGDFVWRYK